MPFVRATTAARGALSAALAAALLACGDAPATAPATAEPDAPRFITNGVPTGTTYGNVGALLIDDGGDGTIDGICTGSLIAPTVFLTAAHCTGGPGTIYSVSFSPDVLPLKDGGPFIQSTTAFASATDDIGVIILPAGSTASIPVLSLPSEGFLDALSDRGGLARDRAVLVGYGTASLHRGPLTSRLDGVRKVATAKVLSLKGSYALIADGHGQSGQGGTCGGDSGGPVFLAGQDPNLLVAITTAGYPAGCHAIGIYTRLDTASALAFLTPFLAQP